MIILGVDPGSLTTGFGVIQMQGNRLLPLEFGAIKLNKIEEMSERLWLLARELEALIQKHCPCVLAVEKVFHSVNFQSALKLGYARGVVLMTAARCGLPVAEYAATEVKKSITGYGRAEKTQVQDMVVMLLGLRERPQPIDASDALGLAICHAHMAPLQARIQAATNAGLASTVGKSKTK